MFNQIDCRPEDSPGGLGVGLNLARGLIEQHGGKLEARSGGPAVAANSWSDLPLLIRSPDDEEGQEARSQIGSSPTACRVLVVDDDRDVADSLVMLLRCLGAEARVDLLRRRGIEASR